MKIGDFDLKERPLLIAETSLNHNGSIEQAIAMVGSAAKAGVDAVKFQTFRTDAFCRPDDPLYPAFKKAELPPNAWPVLKAACDAHGVMFLSTPQNYEDLELLLPLGIEAIKVGSDDFINLPLITRYAQTGLPLILSCGMSDWSDVCRTVRNTAQWQRAVMVCTSQYPTPDHEANMLRVRRLHEYVGTVGFSDHTLGNTAAVMAVAQGACIFEKHFTLDKSLDGPDHAWACNPLELSQWVTAIREAWAMKGSHEFTLSEQEAQQKRMYQRQPGEQLRGS